MKNKSIQKKRGGTINNIIELKLTDYGFSSEFEIPLKIWKDSEYWKGVTYVNKKLNTVTALLDSFRTEKNPKLNFNNLSSCKKIVLDGEQECFDDAIKAKVTKNYGKDIDQLKQSICKEELNKDYCIYKKLDLGSNEDEEQRFMPLMPLLKGRKNLLLEINDGKREKQFDDNNKKYYFNKYKADLIHTQYKIKEIFPHILKTLESKYDNYCVLNIKSNSLDDTKDDSKCYPYSRIKNNFIDNYKDTLINNLCKNTFEEKDLGGKRKFVIINSYQTKSTKHATTLFSHAVTLLVDLDNHFILYFDSNCISCTNQNGCPRIQKKIFRNFTIPTQILKIIYNFVKLDPEIIIYINPIRSQTGPTCYLYSIFSTITMITNKITIPTDDPPYFQDIGFQSDLENISLNRHDLITFFMKQRIPVEYIEYFILRNFTFDEPSGIYDGELVDGKKSGFGIMKYKDGDVYKGEWKNDKREGKGTMTYNPDNSDTYGEYTGDWKNDKRDGLGIMKYKDGDVYDFYEGEWKEGEKNGDGKGKLKYSNGDILYNENNKKKLILKGLDRNDITYEGDFNKNNEIDGKGTMSTNTEYYKGYFRQNYENTKIYCYKNYEDYNEDTEYNEQYLLLENNENYWIKHKKKIIPANNNS